MSGELIHDPTYPRIEHVVEVGVAFKNPLDEVSHPQNVPFASAGAQVKLAGKQFKLPGQSKSPPHIIAFGCLVRRKTVSSPHR